MVRLLYLLTPTLQTTFKYVIITLQADNHERVEFSHFCPVGETNLIAIITMLGGSLAGRRCDNARHYGHISH